MQLAVVGLGFMGATHIKALESVQGAKLAAVVSSDEKKLSGDLSGISGNLGNQGEKLDFSQISKYKRPEEAFADPAIDAVDLCLPTDKHAPLAIAAMRAGKHVLVEKPMALNEAQCQQMLEASRETGKILMCAQVLRFFPAYTKLRELVQNGGLGPIRSAVFRRRCAAPTWNPWITDVANSGGGVFDLLIHDIDFCLHAFGMPEAVAGTGYEDLKGGQDFLHATLFYANHGPVIVTGGWHHRQSYPFSMEYTVSGDKGTLEFDSESRPVKLYHEDGSVSDPALDQVDGFAAELQYFADCVNTGQQPERCSPAESAASVRVTQLLLSSRAQGGAKLSL